MVLFSKAIDHKNLGSPKLFKLIFFYRFNIGKIGEIIYSESKNRQIAMPGLNGDHFFISQLKGLSFFDLDLIY